MPHPDVQQKAALRPSGQNRHPRADWIEEKYGYSYNEIIEFSEELAERFQDDFDCNESENDAWIDRITEMFNAYGRKENNND